jgi:hypothetical protein
MPARYHRLDHSDKPGIDAEARAVVERIADEGAPVDHPSLSETYPRVRPTQFERIVERLVWGRPHLA